MAPFPTPVALVAADGHRQTDAPALHDVFTAADGHAPAEAAVSPSSLGVARTVHFDCFRPPAHAPWQGTLNSLLAWAWGRSGGLAIMTGFSVLWPPPPPA